MAGRSRGASRRQLPPPTFGVVCVLPHLPDPNVPALVLLASSIFLTACNSTSPKLTALEMRDGQFHFSAVHGRTLKWRARDRPCGRLGSPVRCSMYSMYRSSVGVHFALSACQQSARPPASIHDESPSMGSSSICQIRHTSRRPTTSRQGLPQKRVCLPVTAILLSHYSDNSLAYIMAVSILSHPRTVATLVPRISTWRRAETG